MCCPIYIKQVFAYKGGTNLIEIYFQDSLDARKLYASLQNHKMKSDFKDITITFNYNNLISISGKTHADDLLKSLLVSLLAEFILKIKEDQWLLAIIANFFYYDYEEQQQILSIAHSISDGDIKNIPGKQAIVSRHQLIEKILHQFLKVPISFSFESFVKFRLKQYHDTLFQFVEMAIDEYKLEQEYQSFIQTLRELLDNRQPKMSRLHLVHQGTLFRFFNDTFQEIGQEEMKQLLDRKLLKGQHIFIDSAVIAPLVSIAPDQINLYTNDVDHNLIQTILNLFQERVKLFSIKEFKVQA